MAKRVSAEQGGGVWAILDMVFGNPREAGSIFGLFLAWAKRKGSSFQRLLAGALPIATGFRANWM